MKLMHIITSLEIGGAQAVLIQLLKDFQKKGIIQIVISLKPNGGLEKQIYDLNIPLHQLQFEPFNFFKQRSNLEHVIATFQPDIIQSWLYHADFLTIFIRNKNNFPIIWGIHHSYGSNSRIKLSTRIIVILNSIFSHFVPRKIICCSKSALKTHSQIGYEETKLTVIANGIDVNRYQPELKAGNTLRAEFGLHQDTKLIGYIARYHPQKDHATFFNAANLLLENYSDIHFILAGNQVVPDNPEFQKFLLSCKFPSHFHFLGQRKDIPVLTAGLDIATLTSSGDEAFPLTILEAMACGIPCVSTNVGDIMEVLETGGIIVPPRNPKALSDGWKIILDLSPIKRAHLGNTARDRVVNLFSNEIMTKKYLDVYYEVIKYQPVYNDH